MSDPAGATTDPSRNPIVSFCRALVASSKFDIAIMGVILINAVALGVETYYTGDSSATRTLDLINGICLGIYVFELSARLIACFPRPQRAFRDRSRPGRILGDQRAQRLAVPGGAVLDVERRVKVEIEPLLRHRSSQKSEQIEGNRGGDHQHHELQGDVIEPVTGKRRFRLFHASLLFVSSFFSIVVLASHSSPRKTELRCWATNPRAWKKSLALSLASTVSFVAPRAPASFSTAS